MADSLDRRRALVAEIDAAQTELLEATPALRANEAEAHKRYADALAGVRKAQSAVADAAAATAAARTKARRRQASAAAELMATAPAEIDTLREVLDRRATEALPWVKRFGDHELIPRIEASGRELRVALDDLAMDALSRPEIDARLAQIRTAIAAIPGPPMAAK